MKNFTPLWRLVGSVSCAGLLGTFYWRHCTGDHATAAVDLGVATLVFLLMPRGGAS